VAVVGGIERSDEGVSMLIVVGTSEKSMGNVLG